MLKMALAQEWDCVICKKHIIGGVCDTCGCTFTEYLSSRGKKISGDAE